MEAGEPAFRRILLKLSGEALMGDLDYGADPERIQAVAAQVAGVQARGVEVAIVVGAGNIYRGMAGAAAGYLIMSLTLTMLPYEPSNAFFAALLGVTVGRLDIRSAETRMAPAE